MPQWRTCKQFSLMNYPRHYTNTSFVMQLSGVYVDFISQLLSVTTTKPQNINFTQEQEMHAAQSSFHHIFYCLKRRSKVL
jgi:hypothetical protein